MHPALLPLRMFLFTVPDGLHSRVLAAVFNHTLRGQNITSRFVEIEGKTVALHVKDVPCRFHFLFNRTGIEPDLRQRADVVIAGNLHDFMRLAWREEDPDTLFFTRQLTIEGETETGLHVKNLLDSLEFDLDVHLDTVLPQPLAGPARKFVSLLRQYAPDLRRFSSR
ncbi:MAG: SCP2 sterol-binding domain-containing protein [Pseudomonadales bacterium]|nr:SCP2 sterol-binding domain-containing protein [Pseudomonadales bacterium]